MKKRDLTLILAFAVLFTAFFGCSKDSVKVTPRPMNLDESVNNSDDPLFSLGRVLFYDTRLSLNNSISCASCHKQTLSFGDNVNFSSGFQNEPTLRNTISIQNITSSGFGFQSFFWDGREFDLSNVVVQPVFNHVEMGMEDSEALVERLRATTYYPDLFYKAFNSNDINVSMIRSALYGFVSLIGAPLNPRAFDKTKLSAIELQGFELFNTKYECNSCHSTGPYSGSPFNFANIGLDLNYADHGRYNVTGRNEDIGLFRVPTLINIALTAPYMHDGRFESLDQVLAHYSNNIKSHVNLNQSLKDSNGQPKEFNITAQEKDALKAYLNSFTDITAVGDQNFSNPFHF